MRDFLEVFIGFVLFLVALSVPFIVIEDILYLRKCNNYEKTTGKETKYLTLDSCYVKTPAGWQRWDEYTARSTASEGLSN